MYEQKSKNEFFDAFILINLNLLRVFNKRKLLI